MIKGNLEKKPRAFEMKEIDKDEWLNVYLVEEVDEWVEVLPQIDRASSLLKISVITLIVITLISTVLSVWFSWIGNPNISRSLIGPSLSGLVGLYFIINSIKTK